MSPDLQRLATRIYASDGADFEELALAVFEYQREACRPYREWLTLSKQSQAVPSTWRDIPCVPIDLFRTHDMRSGKWEPRAVFRSSGTTGKDTSASPVFDLATYRTHCLRTFGKLVGSLEGVTLLALLPGYLERTDSGLVAMVSHFMQEAAPGSGFFLEDYAGLRAAVAKTRENGGKVLLWGVTFALLELARGPQLVLPEGSYIVETGGMKGRGPELTRHQLHTELRMSFDAPIISEYGMTELQSQAYLTEAHFRPAPTLRAVSRDLSDPMTTLHAGKQGGLNFVDLANVHTCAFLQTEDLGRVYGDDTFDVLGRVDRSIARGCNLLVQA